MLLLLGFLFSTLPDRLGYSKSNLDLGRFFSNNSEGDTEVVFCGVGQYENRVLAKQQENVPKGFFFNPSLTSVQHFCKAVRFRMIGRTCQAMSTTSM